MLMKNELKGYLAKNGYTQKAMAQKLGMTEQTFRKRLKMGYFNTNEMEIMIDTLHIENPIYVFLGK